MSAVANVYAKAFFEVATTRGDLAPSLVDIKAFLDACAQSAPLTAVVLKRSAIGVKSIAAVVAEVSEKLELGVSAKAFLNYLASKSRISELREIFERIEALREESRGILLGEVSSAVEIPHDSFQGLCAAVEKRVGSKVRLTKIIDPEILGGVVIKVAGKTFDASLRTQLEKFKTGLI